MTAPDAGEVVRRLLLALTLAQLCQLDLAAVVQPVCPHCNEGPAMALPAGQAFCGNDACDVFTWQLTEDAATFDRKAKHLEATEDGHGGIVWRPAP